LQNTHKRNPIDNRLQCPYIVAGSKKSLPNNNRTAMHDTQVTHDDDVLESLSVIDLRNHFRREGIAYGKGVSMANREELLLFAYTGEIPPRIKEAGAPFKPGKSGYKLKKSKTNSHSTNGEASTSSPFRMGKDGLVLTPEDDAILEKVRPNWSLWPKSGEELRDSLLNQGYIIDDSRSNIIHAILNSRDMNGTPARRMVLDGVSGREVPGPA